MDHRSGTGAGQPCRASGLRSGQGRHSPRRKPSSDPGARISAAGFSWSSIGENIATGYPTPAAVLAAWMSSTGHCQNILSPSFRYIGQGVSARDIRGISSGPATWTTDFGLPSEALAPSGNAGPASHCPY